MRHRVVVSVTKPSRIHNVNRKHCTHCGLAIQRAVHPRTIRPFCDSRCYGLWQRGKRMVDQGKRARAVRLCSEPDCDRVHFGLGFCRKHYLSKAYKPSQAKRPRAQKRSQIKCLHCDKSFPMSHKGSKYCSRLCSALGRRKPFIVKKGYRKLLIPGHPRADAKGYVFEHIVVVESAIGRPLQTGEEVHHRDFNRQNNAAENLQVCRNHAEHMKLHASSLTSTVSD